jgi:hypothetical protein
VSIPAERWPNHVASLTPPVSQATQFGSRRPGRRWTARLTTEWQVGDGREEALRAYVLDNAPAGDLDAAIDVIDEFAYERSFLSAYSASPAAWRASARSVNPSMRRIRPSRKV